MAKLEQDALYAAAGLAFFKLVDELTPASKVGEIPNFIIWGGGGLVAGLILGTRGGIAFSIGGYAGAIAKELG